MHKHIDTVLARMRRKYWALRHLKRLGVNKSELVTVYKTSILPIADYCDVVYHSLLSDDQDEALERAQVGALRPMFDYKLSGRKLRKLAGVTMLRERRISHCVRFAAKYAASGRFSDLFPLREVARNFQEIRRNLCPLWQIKEYFMRRRLNGKEGRSYGQRNGIQRNLREKA